MGYVDSWDLVAILWTHLDVNFVGGRNELLELSRGFVKSWLGNVGHEDIGAFFGEEDACFKANAARKSCESAFSI